MTTKATKETAVKQYKVLIPCTSNATGKKYAIGDTITGNDFSTAVIINWCQITPPVLQEVE